MRKTLQSYMDLLTPQQRRAMAVVLLRIAADVRVPEANRIHARARAAELDPQAVLPDTTSRSSDRSDAASVSPPTELNFCNDDVDLHQLVCYYSAMKPHIGYARASTRQSDAAPSVEEQEAAIRRYLETIGGTLIDMYLDGAAGTTAERKELANAIVQAEKTGAKLVVTSLDRIGRTVAALSPLMESGVDFVCCDDPIANRSTLPVLARITEAQAAQASQRAKAALNEARARGKKLGSNRPGHWADPGRAEKRLEGIRKAARHSAILRAAAAKDAYAHLEPMIRDLWLQGLTLRGVAAKLNEQGLQTRKKKPWNPVQVSRVIARMKEKGILSGEQPRRSRRAGAGEANDTASQAR